VNEHAVAPVTDPALSRRHAGRTLRHVPALDGLRGLAVLAVVVYHLSSSTLPGGFLGVSLFFTLSGFLITNLLLAEWRRDRSVDLGRFWGRRFRRLLPAALVGLVLVLLLAWLSADSDQLADLRGDVVGALTYVANWRFIFNGDAYGAGYQEPSQVLHYWSLAIEEQFYIVVAVVALVLARHAKSRKTWLLVFGGFAALSMLATLLLMDGSTNRIYFGSDTRAFELLAGVLLAIVLGFELPERAKGWVWRHALAIVVLAGVIATYLFAATTHAWLYRGGFWLVALGSVALIVSALDDGPVARLLSWAPLTALGLISYGVYVYHWPLFLWLDEERTGLSGAPLVVVRLAATLALAILSYRLLEQPIRQRRWSWRPVAIGAAMAASFGLLVVGAALLGSQAGGRAVVGETPEIQLSAPSAITVPSPNPTTPVPTPPLRRVLFVGDSIVHQAWPTIEDRLAQAGIEARAIGGEGEHLLFEQASWIEDLRHEIAAFDPDLVVLESCCGWGSPWIDETYIAPDGTALEPDTDASWTEWARMARVLTELAQRDGRAVTWLMSPPARTNGYYGPVEGRITRANAIYERIVQCNPGVGILDWRVIAAPDGSFTWELPDASGTPVQVRHPDGLHFTREGQAVLADYTRDTLIAQWEASGGRHPAPAPVCPI
jgi:peptidoglycan/LPS O-acetylase OafA/YrhL